MSTDNHFTKENIKRHINFYTSAEVANRGRNLYKNDKVFFDDYIEKTDSWKFPVLGSTEYQVLIKGVNSQNIQTSCTCLFDWGNICKHTVAALLFVSDNLGEQFALQYQKQSKITLQTNQRNRKNFGFEIPDYQHIDFDFVKRNVSSNVLTQLIYQGTYNLYTSVEITPESITFIAANADAYVKFYWEDGKVYVTSPRAANASKLTPEEAQCLKLIANSSMPNLLDEVFIGRILEAQKEKLTRFGLPENTNFDDYFTYIFKEKDGLMFYPSKKGEGLIPVTENSYNHISVLLEELNNDKLLLAKLPKKSEQRELGFVLKKGYRFYDGYHNSYDDFYEDNENDRYEIVPIVGKTNKNNPSALATHIKEYDEEMDTKFIINKSENAKKLLRLIDEIDESSGNDFQLMKKAFDYLIDEKFVYGLADSAYRLRKKDLLEITLSPEPVDVVFEVSKTRELLTLHVKIKIGTELQKRKVLRSQPADNYLYVSGNTYHFAKSEKVAQIIADFPEKVKMVATHKEEFYKNVVEPISKNFEVQFKKSTFKSATVELDFHKKQLFLSEQNEYVVFTPRVEYDHDVSAILSTTGNLLQKNG